MVKTKENCGQGCEKKKAKYEQEGGKKTVCWGSIIRGGEEIENMEEGRRRMTVILPKGKEGKGAC